MTIDRKTITERARRARIAAGGACVRCRRSDARTAAGKTVCARCNKAIVDAAAKRRGTKRHKRPGRPKL